jgi:uncharacterized membrane protein
MGSTHLTAQSKGPEKEAGSTISAHGVRQMLRALAFASAVCVGMVLVRFACVGDLRFRYSGLLLNLLLAWLPMVLALLVRRASHGRGSLLFWTAFATWLLFFPNAFYITTDLIHTRRYGMDGVFEWYDLLTTVSFACGGMFLGSLSLYLLHVFVRERRGRRAGWLFAGAMLALGSFGIYLGRFLRLNSWDVFARPVKLAGDIAGLVESNSLREVASFCIAFFFFSLAVYGFVVSAAHLHVRSPRTASTD